MTLTLKRIKESLSELECLGHVPDDHEEQGRTAYCDGTCRAGRGTPRDKLLADLRDLLRRDWDVRVLDAWAKETRQLPVQTWPLQGGGWQTDSGSRRLGSGFTPDAARHAAALAVFPTLDRNSPNWPGEEP